MQVIYNLPLTIWVQQTDNRGEINLKKFGNFTTKNDRVNAFAFHKFIGFRLQMPRSLCKQKVLKLDRLPRLRNFSNFRGQLVIARFVQCANSCANDKNTNEHFRKNSRLLDAERKNHSLGCRKLLFTCIIFGTYFKLNQSFFHRLHVKYHLNELLNSRGQQRFTSGCNGRLEFLIILAIVDL